MLGLGQGLAVTDWFWRMKLIGLPSPESRRIPFRPLLGVQNHAKTQETGLEKGRSPKKYRAVENVASEKPISGDTERVT